ncbi:hypothetical protein Q1695_001449 [Nippostrongylus brasiliensis]|nr:hypothetical protein Q1695_001449 [Nippostrongylus brasiliensis]
MHHVAKPEAPFVFPFHQKLESNCKIDIFGEVSPSEDRYFVDILSGPHSLLNIEFTFGDQRWITLRSCSSDIDTNEIDEISNPLKGGMKFHINIVVRLNYYHIRLNGYTIALFPHRFPPELAQCIAISKCVKIVSVNVEGFQNRREWNFGSIESRQGSQSTEQPIYLSGEDLRWA